MARMGDKFGRWWRTFMAIATMPWACLQAAIEQILQESDHLAQQKQLRDWQRLKNTELTNMSFAGTLIASAVTGSIQWGALGTAHWAVFAVWYGTLVFSLMSIMVAFYLSILLSNFTVNKAGNELLLRALHSSNNARKARWASLFALQVPVMLLSYALILYIVGLSLLVMRPLWVEPWGTQSLIAIVYSGFLFLSMAAFASVCHFIYVQNEELLKVS